ncbi:DUF6049 family protein [Blastococcus sp. PRF04-17]|uniref:DUF6049 family protein n=1 Tax=Blastococcus sp. PRF04-17 TaxID=2933797 RepID=UPI001FF1E9C9|nr:DUF6049 family protein [Blastococcus sp. PRF04-17]UOY00575.1 DUF6049 family protein [Blastococcus sp. PRF04-17]
MSTPTPSRQPGLTAALTRALPGTPSGTAQDPPGDPDGAAETSPPAGSNQTSSPGSGQGPAAGTGAGAEIISRVLDVEPRTDLAWAAGGTLRPDTIDTLLSGGVRGLVLGAEGLTAGERAVGIDGTTAAARTAVNTPTGSLGALIADPTLGGIVGAAERTPGGARMAEQRYLAELAVIGMQAPEGAAQTVLVAPPRTLEAGPDGAGAMLADTAALPWLGATTLEELAAGPAVPAGQLVDPVDGTHLDPAGLAAVTSSVVARDDLAGAVVEDPDTALRTLDAAIARTTSVAWRTDPEGFRAAAGALVETIDRMRGRVTLLAPANGTYSLASSDSPLVLTVHNDLPVAVDVRLAVETRGTAGLSIGDIGVQRLAPDERTTLQVPTEVRRSGGFAVTAQLTTPDGTPLGDQISLQVKSTAYGSISLFITIGAAALLGLLFLRRLVNFVLRRRRAGRAAGEAVPEAPEGAGVQPPNRSPV